MRICTFFLLSASLFGATRDDLRRLVKERKTAPRAASAHTSSAHTRAAGKIDRLRNVVISSGDVVMPFIVNADFLRTRIRLVNLEKKDVEFELLFVADDGGEASIDLKDRGLVDAVKGKLAPLGVTTLETTATGEETVVWAFFDANGANIAATVSVELEEDIGIYGASYSALHLLDPKVTTLFDNTEGHDTEISIVNLNTVEANVTLVVRDAEGRTLNTQTQKFGGLNAGGFAPADEVRASRGARGTVECSVDPASKAGVAAMAVQFFERGGITFFPGFALIP